MIFALQYELKALPTDDPKVAAAFQAKDGWSDEWMSKKIGVPSMVEKLHIGFAPGKTV